MVAFIHLNKLSQSLVNRIEYKSIGDIVGRILLMDMPFIEDLPQPNTLREPRVFFIDSMISKFSQTENIDEITNIVYIFNELLNKYDRVNSSQLIVEHLMKSDLQCFFTPLLEGNVFFSIFF